MADKKYLYPVNLPLANVSKNGNLDPTREFIRISLNSTLNFGWDLGVKCPKTREVFLFICNQCNQHDIPRGDENELLMW